MPAGLQCAGTVGPMQNTCLVKIANTNPAGPFGGVIMAQNAPAGASPAGASPAGESTGTKSTKNAKDQQAKGSGHARRMARNFSA